MYKTKIVYILCLLHLTNSTLKTLSENRRLKDCVNYVIKNVFQEDETLLFTKIGADKTNLLDTTEHPFMVVNLKNKIKKFDNFMYYKQNFITHLEIEAIPMFLPLLYKSVFWNQTASYEGTYIFVTPFKSVDIIFKHYWSIGIINLIVIVYNNNKNSINVFTSDPQAPQNNCEQEFLSMNVQSCGVKKTIKLPELLRKFTNCKIVLANKRQLEISAINFILETTSTHLNATFIIDKNASFYTRFTFRETILGYHKYVLYSSVVQRDDFIWVVPTPKRIPSLEVLKIVFKKSVWIGILASYVLTSIVWWVFLKWYGGGTSELSSVLMMVYSLTLFGSIKQTPAFLTLKLIFITYIVYSIHIQTAFTSNLINILTVPQYEKRISTLEELSNSNVSIHIPIPLYNIYFSNNRSNYSLYTKIRNKLSINTNFFLNSSYRQGKHDVCYFFKKAEGELEQIAINRKHFVITDNALTSNYQVVLSAIYGSYILKTVDLVMNMLIESGIYGKIVQNIEMQRKHNVETVFKHETEDKIVLTVNHLIFVFLLWITGATIAVLIFLTEIIQETSTKISATISHYDFMNFFVMFFCSVLSCHI
ncbi:hypothetical protein RN001_014349 [Aquatica leii]|uniref:Ionotropic glutamate receptor C-terminal domain-containing protein n=1 Tax=Aquatica leii TaxID=1421715 RepID=A0AAN7NUF0_9COLE|nr:hypothetical protein RN001_014349 [Aquatica leii]